MKWIILVWLLTPDGSGFSVASFNDYDHCEKERKDLVLALENGNTEGRWPGLEIEDSQIVMGCVEYDPNTNTLSERI